MLRVAKAEESEGRHESPAVAARSNVLPMGPSSRSTPRKPPVISMPQPGSDSDAAGLGPEPPASARKEPAASRPAHREGDGSEHNGHIVSKPRLRQQLEQPLAAMANQTVGEIQQQMQGAPQGYPGTPSSCPAVAACMIAQAARCSWSAPHFISSAGRGVPTLWRKAAPSLA